MQPVVGPSLEAAMKTRQLGKQGLKVSELGLGVTFLDTADVYGPHTNEVTVGKALRGKRDSVVLATKFGLVREPGSANRGVNGNPDYVRASCEASLKRLG